MSPAPRFLAALLIAFATICPAQQPAKDAPSKAPEYSKEAYVIRSANTSLTFNADGTGTRESTVEVEVLSAGAVRDLGVLSFDYTAASEHLEIVYIRVHKKDGTVVETPQSNAHDMPAEVSRQAPMYSDLHQVQIPVRSLSAGDILEHKTRIIVTKPEIPGQFWYAYNFSTDVIVLNETLTIRVPQAKYVKISSPANTPQIKQADDWKEYTWKSSHLTREDLAKDSAKSGKLGKPAEKPPAPAAVQLTTFQSWEELGNWYSALATPQAAVTPEIQAKVLELTKGLTTDEAKQRAIYDYVSTKFRYISLSFGVGRYRPHTAVEVLDNQYGDCKDKHTLLAALLKAAGFEAWPVLIGVNLAFDPSLPSPAQFNHVITAVPRKDGFLWLDATPEVAPFGMLMSYARDHQALLAAPAGASVKTAVVTTPAEPPFPAFWHFDIKGSLSAEGVLTAHVNMTMRGDEEVLFRIVFHQAAPSNWQDVVQAISASSGFAGVVSNVDVSDAADTKEPFHYSYDYNRTDYGDWPDRRIGPPFPGLGLAFSEDDAKPLEPIFMGAKGEIVLHASIQLPKGALLDLLGNQSVQTPFADYSATYRVSDGTLEAERKLVRVKSKLPVGDWEGLVKFAKTVNDDQGSMMQLTLGGGSAPATARVTDPEASRLIAEAVADMQRQDFNAAREALSQAERKNPDQMGLWGAYAMVDLVQRQPAKAIEAFKREIRNYPTVTSTYQFLANVQKSEGKLDDAIGTLRDLVKVQPANADSIVLLSSFLVEAKHPQEALDLLQKMPKDAPAPPALQAALANALFAAGRKEEGAAAIRKSLSPSPDADNLNSVGYQLADNNVDLPFALDCLTKAVDKAEDSLKDVSLDKLSNEDLRHVVSLGQIWDSVGWAYFRMERFDKAETYLKAAWRLLEDGNVADHLGQLYEKTNKPHDAEHAYRIAVQAGPKNDHASARAGGSKEVADELSQMRTAPLPGQVKEHLSAEFFLLFTPAGISEVQFISGDEGLRSKGADLRQAHFDLPYPDAGPEKIPRRGVVSCSTYTHPNCQLTLFLPNSTRK